MVFVHFFLRAGAYIHKKDLEHMRLFPVGAGTYAPSLSSAFLILLIFQRGYAKTAAEQANEYRGIGKARQRCRVRYTLSLV